MTMIAIFTAAALAIGPLTQQAQDSPVLGAATNHIHALWTKSTPGRILAVDPRQLVVGVDGWAVAERRVFEVDTNVTAGIARVGAIETLSLARAKACDDYIANDCMQQNAFLSVALSAPRVTGDSATVEALVTLVRGTLDRGTSWLQSEQGLEGVHARAHRPSAPRPAVDRQ